MLNHTVNLAVVASAADTEKEAKLIAILKSEATPKEKADACRELARVASIDAIPTLASFLSDEKLAHMARYGLETISSPVVDEIFRDALGKLQGTLLVGVIGSLGVRRDTKAIGLLTPLMKNEDPVVAQAAARALGSMGTVEAGKAILATLADLPPANVLAFCEGLFRCAEILCKQGLKAEANAIYEQLRTVKEPHQVRAGALRGAVMTRCGDGLALLLEAIRGDDYILVAAAARTAQELRCPDVTRAIKRELIHMSPNKQELFKKALLL